MFTDALLCITKHLFNCSHTAKCLNVKNWSKWREKEELEGDRFKRAKNIYYRGRNRFLREYCDEEQQGKKTKAAEQTDLESMWNETTQAGGQELRQEGGAEKSLQCSHVVEGQVQLLTQSLALQLLSIHFIWSRTQKCTDQGQDGQNEVGAEKMGKQSPQ